MADDVERHADALAALINQRAADGAFVFSDDDVRHFLPLLCLSVARELPDVEFPASVQTLLAEFAAASGIDGTTAPDQVQQAVEKFYAARPIAPGLKTAVEQFLRELLQEGGDAAVAAVHRVLGSERVLKPLERTAPPPTGAVAAGPAARFAAQGMLPTAKKKK